MRQRYVLKSVINDYIGKPIEVFRVRKVHNQTINITAFTITQTIFWEVETIDGENQRNLRN